MRYTVDPVTFAINIWALDAPPVDENNQVIEDIPFQYQPDYPNGDPFESVEEATAWAEASIAAHSPDVLFFAPIGKGIAPEAKPDPNAKQNVLAKLGITAEEARLLLS